MLQHKSSNFLRLLFVSTALVFCIFPAASVAFSADTNEEQLEHAKLSDKLKSIEQHLKAVTQNQQKISTKNLELKTDLDSLGVWIRRG